MRETLEHIQLSSRKVLDGSLKIHFCLLLLLFVVTSGKVSVYLAAFAIFSCLSLYAAGWYYIRILKVPVYFLISGIIIILLFIPGKTAYQLYFLKISEEGIDTAINTTLRALASLSIMSFMILTTTIPELFSTFKRLRLPGFIVEMCLLVYRVIQILLDEAAKLDMSASSRLGYASKKVFVNTTALLSYSLFLRSLKRSEKLDRAMDARCYSGEMPVLDKRSRGYKHAITITVMLISMWWFL
ncbi:cobalt ABC transporter, permease protein CbiQ [Archaeoglobus sulfaticallidus PM70-1]|uniref:Cobalt ABC transporter, permease protein CbiQ n=1 Tax=Archaeoglobus sulfaticallidus PM70-1 TaxID=387631 RepID=N0BIN9_9EURY|nr:cobalt ECF transporter T component CbiQ [Archaeoglobus sulfaticallidus]AGK62192.1 cobalt ABC transporter, permease protein CbiQ [Archaeoglobus sulfaticallidus PM70-1]